MVATGFKADIGRGPSGQLTGLLQGVDLRMGATGLLVPALPYNGSLTHQHTTHPRVGIGAIHAKLGQLQGTGHVLNIFGAKICHAGCHHYRCMANGFTHCPSFFLSAAEASSRES